MFIDVFEVLLKHMKMQYVHASYAHNDKSNYTFSRYILACRQFLVSSEFCESIPVHDHIKYTVHNFDTINDH